MSTPRYIFGPYTLADSGRVLLRDGEPVPVTPKVLATLSVLVRAEGKAVSKEDLLQTVWPDSFVEDGNLTQNISVLRKLLAQDYPEASPIETIARFGYRFRAELTVADAPGVASEYPAFPEQEEPAASLAAFPERGSSAHLTAEMTMVGTPPVRESSGPAIAPPKLPKQALFLPAVLSRWAGLRSFTAARTRLPAVAGVLLVLAGVVIFSALLHKRNVSAASSRTLHPRIAVLAFTNLSQSPEAAWLSGALRETLTTDLGSDPNLRVLPNESVERAERELQLGRTDGLSRDTLGRVCDDLDCTAVVSGSYLIAGGKVRLDAHLLDAETGEVLGNYIAIRPVDDLLPLIGQIGASMRSTFGLRPAPAASRETLRASVSRNPEAYRLYIEGLEHVRVFDGRAAVDLLERSIALDPQFPLSHSALSGAYVILGQQGKAVVEAHRAEALDGSLAREDQLKIRAGARNAEGRFQDAAEIYHDLFSMYPDNLQYGTLFAAELSYAGHPQQAIDAMRPVVAQKSPADHDPRLYSVIADAYSMMGDWPSSLSWAKAGAEESQRRGARVMYGRLLTTETQALLYLHRLPEALSQTEEALAIARQFRDLSGELRALNRLGQIETAMGRLPEAQKLLEQALSLEEEWGETERQIHTLSALGQNLQQQHDPAQAALMFQRELTMSKDYHQSQFTAQAQLNIARLEIQQGNVRGGKEMLRVILQQAAQFNDGQLVADATQALKATPPGH